MCRLLSVTKEEVLTGATARRAVERVARVTAALAVARGAGAGLAALKGVVEGVDRALDGREACGEERVRLRHGGGGGRGGEDGEDELGEHGEVR